MSIDLKNAYERAFKYANDNVPLSLEIIKELSSLVNKNTGTFYNLASGSWDERKGEFRKGSARAGLDGKSYMAYDKIEINLDELVKKVNADLKNKELTPFDIYDIAFKFHGEFEVIHPFSDGNGRLGRLLINYIESSFELPLSYFFAEYKTTYIDALKASRENKNYEIISEFLMNELCNNLNEEIQAHKREYKINDQQEYLPPKKIKEESFKNYRKKNLSKSLKTLKKYL